VRISLDQSGEQLGVQRQREDCLRIAAEKGWKVVAEYADPSTGAYDKRKRRPGYDAMVDAFRIGLFDALICWDLDRLTRQPRQLEDWIDAAEDRGLRLVTANGEADLSTDGGRTYARIKASVARAESERKAARQRRAALQRAEQGKSPLGVRLTGYTPKGELVVPEADLVRRMFQRFHAGDSLRAIVAWLTETGTPTRRHALEAWFEEVIALLPNGYDGSRDRRVLKMMAPKLGATGSAAYTRAWARALTDPHGKPWRWSPSSVRDILTNPRYCGRSTYNRHRGGKPGTWTPGHWDAIVSEDIWEAVNARLEDPRRRKQVGTHRKYLGSGLFLCGICDSRVVSQGSAAIGSRYRCRAGAHFTRSAYLIDQAVLTAIRARLAQPDVADLLTSVESPEAKAAAEEIRRLRGRLTATERDYDADLIDGRRYKIKTAKINAQLASAEAAQQRLAAPSGVGDILAATDPVAAFNRASLGQQRAVIAFFVTVRLYPAPRGRKGLDPATVEIERNNG
jgi:DNA invertase Pin-like site-specific DNA recombinase